MEKPADTGMEGCCSENPKAAVPGRRKRKPGLESARLLPGLQVRSAFIPHSVGWAFVANMRWPLAVSHCQLFCLSILPAKSLGVPTVCQLFPRGRPSDHTKPQPGALAASHAAHRELAAARWRSAPAYRSCRGGRPLRLRRRSGRRRGSRRRLCDFGFDLPGDELIPQYNRLRGDRKMAARYLRRHGDHRARAGRGPGKIQPLWRRVSLTARTSGGELGSVAPAVRPWRRGPRARTGTPGRSQTPQTATRPVSLSSIPQIRHTALSSSQSTSSPESAQHRLKQGSKMTLRFAHLSVHLVALGTHCPTDPSLCHGLKRRLLRPSRSFGNTPCGVRPARAARNIHEWLQTPLLRPPKQHSPGPGNCRSSQYIRSCTRLAHPLHASPRGHVQHPFPRASRRPLPGTRHEHSPRVCSGTRTRALCRGTLARTLTSVLAQGPLAGIPTCSSKHTGQSRGAHSPPGEPPADAICLPIGARICGGKCCIRWRAHLLCAL